MRRSAVITLAIALFALIAPIIPRPAFASERLAVVDTERPALRASLARAGIALRTPRQTVEPFQMIGVQYTGTESTGARVRLHRDGTWSSWFDLVGNADDPLWVEQADGYELDVPAGANDVKVHLVRESTERVRLVTRQAVSEAGAAPPPILSRGSWGARAPRVTPTVSPLLELAVVHHTATAGQSYSSSQVPSIIRGIQAYHLDANGWNDIAYNFVADRFGRIWEARAGGIAKAVVGGHSKGFNSRSFGVVLLGDFTYDYASNAMVNAVGDLLAWKLFIHGVDPRSKVRYESLGSPKYTAGTVVTLNAISGHRDVQLTACPGNHLYSRMSTIRARAAAGYDARKGNAAFTKTGLAQDGDLQPLRGDFNGDARDDVFFYGPGAAPDSMLLGQANGTLARRFLTVNGTYQPVVGDFDHDGRSDILWYGAGTAPDSLWFGTTSGSFTPKTTSIKGTYQPVVGDFDRNLRSDVLWYGPGGAPDSLWLGAPDRKWTYVSTNVSGSYEPLVGDFDDDHFSDVLWYGRGSAKDAMWRGGTRGKFLKQSIAMPMNATPLLGDFAGGAGTDIFWYAGAAGSEVLWVSSSTGRFSSIGANVSGSYEPFVGDFNGGGRDDIFWYGRSLASDSVWLATGSGSFSSHSQTAWFDARPVAIDGNGDGRDDVIWYGVGALPDAYWRG